MIESGSISTSPTRAQTWDDLLSRLHGLEYCSTNPHLAQFYRLALLDGVRSLSSYRRALGDDRIHELTHDFLTRKLFAILQAKSPKAFFTTSLRNHVRSWLRRKSSLVVESRDDECAEEGVPERRETLTLAVLDARRALAAVPAYQREIFMEALGGEDRETIAHGFGTTRANVDQIICRVHRRLTISRDEIGG